MSMFKNRMRVPRLATVFLFCVVAATAMVRADGTEKFTFNSLQYNPCNGETVTGQVEVVLGVHVDDEDGSVNVFRQFHGTLTGDQGNTYKVSSIGHAHFDQTFPTYYQISTHNNVIGKGGAPNFEVIGTARIFVDANQNPTGYNAQGLQFICKSE